MSAMNEAGKPPEVAWQLRPMSTLELMEADYSLEWLVESVFVAGQPILIGAPKKCLKTSISIDLGVSLATGTEFLGEFKVPKKKRVMIISGESGPATLRNNCRQVCEARRIPKEIDGLFWQFDCPKLAHFGDLESLAKGLKELSIEVVILDPMYLMILAGAPVGIRTENVMQFGPLVKRAMDTCLNAGAVPVALHHAKKMGSRLNGYEALDLDDLTQTGFAEFARQWLLLNRRERYDGEGIHRLFMSVGGSVGYAREYALDIEEGVMDRSFGRRKWIPTVMNIGELIDVKKAREAQQKETQKTERENEEVKDVLLAVDHYCQMIRRDGGEHQYPILNDIKAHCSRNPGRVKTAVVEAVRRKELEEILVERTVGKGAKRKVPGYRRPTRIESVLFSES